MSSNLSDSKHERDLLNRIARLEQQMRERGTLQIQGDNAVGLQITSNQATFETVPDDDFVTFDCQFVSDTDDIAFAKLEFALFFDVGGNPVPIDSDPLFLLMFPFNSWTTSLGSTNTVQRDLVSVQNQSGITQDIYIGLRWRYAINSGAGGVTVL